MKTLKEYINYITEASTDFPAKNAWKKKDGIVSMQWNCGNEIAQEYLKSAVGAYDTAVALWFDRYMDRIDSISTCIYDNKNGVTGNIYFNIDNIGGRAIKFEGTFDSVKDAKTKMYELFCKIRNDKDILRKMSNVINPDPDKSYLTFDEMMNL